MKVVVLCHFWSTEVSEMLRSEKRKDLSPWIQETLNYYKHSTDVDVHVIAPNYAFNKYSYVKKHDISYHFFKYSFSITPRIIRPFLKVFLRHDDYKKIAERIVNIFTGYLYPKYQVKHLINDINPDIIHLYGSENPDYAVGVLPFFQKYPVLLSIQGYVYLQDKPSNFVNNLNHQLRVKYEKKINRKSKYVAALSMEEGFKPFRNNQHFYRLNPITKIPQISADIVEKKFDIVFFARLCREKGIEDLIEAVYVIYKTKHIKLNTVLIGSSQTSYLYFLKKKIIDYQLEDLFHFVGFIENHNEVFKLAASAKVLVLPSYNDGFNNTIREAMFMKLPIIANRVGGITIANEQKECITLSIVGDIHDLVEKILIVLNDQKRTKRLVNNGYEVMNSLYNPNEVVKSTIQLYQTIIKHHTCCYNDV